MDIKFNLIRGDKLKNLVFWILYLRYNQLLSISYDLER